MKSISSLLLIFFFSSAVCVAQEDVNQNEFTFTDTLKLADSNYFTKIEDFYAKGISGTFTGAAKVEIYFKYFRQAAEEKGAIVISTGRTEGAVKYKEVIYDLYNNGYSVYIHDHRGQGLSGRMAGDPEMGHVDDFQYYVDDLKQFFEDYVKKGEHEKIFLLAHSMGGAIGMNYIEQHPLDFSAAAFSSPMLGLAAYICPLAKILSGKTPKYAPGQTGYNDDYSDFSGNDVTNSLLRYHVKITAYKEVPGARVGGPSVQWLEQSCKHMKLAFKNISHIAAPFVIFTAGDESVVNPEANQKFVAKAQKLGKSCKEIYVENAKHELLMEVDDVRMKVMEDILLFFQQTP